MSDEPQQHHDGQDDSVEVPQEPETPPEESQAPRGRVMPTEELRERSGRSALSETDMTLEEVSEALRDEDHPRHAEAVEINRETAERLKPTLAALNESIRASVLPTMNVLKGWKPPTLSQEVTRAMVPLLKDQEALASRLRPVSQPELPDELTRTFAPPTPAVGLEETHESTIATAKARAEREARQDEQAELSLQALQSMAALLEQAQAEARATRSEMEAVKRKISEGNESATEDARGMLQVGVLTLVATLGSIFITWVLSLSQNG